MKITTKRKSFLLIPIGLLIISASYIFSHFFNLTDLTKGSILGVGIGLFLTSIILRNFKSN